MDAHLLPLHAQGLAPTPALTPLPLKGPTEPLPRPLRRWHLISADFRLQPRSAQAPRVVSKQPSLQARRVWAAHRNTGSSPLAEVHPVGMRVPWAGLSGLPLAFKRRL